MSKLIPYKDLEKRKQDLIGLSVQIRSFELTYNTNLMDHHEWIIKELIKIAKIKKESTVGLKTWLKILKSDEVLHFV